MRRAFSAAMTATAMLIATGAVAAPPGRDGAFNFRAGGFLAVAHSNFWDEKRDNFTLDRSDLNGAIVGVGYSAAIGNYVEFDVNADLYSASARSSDADFLDENDELILHDTTLSIVPVTVGFRFLPAGRYARRGEGRRHYVRRPVPYIGAGIGMAYWQYEEQGDFVFPDATAPSGFSIFDDRLKDSGIEFEKHAKVGIEFPIAPEWNVTLEIRRSWAEATLSEVFPSAALTVDDPRKLDLGGASVFLGASMRF